LRRIVFIIIALVLPLASVTGQQNNAALDAQLRELFPGGASFSTKEGDPPHFKVFASPVSGAAPELLGLAFWTTELDPLERGFDGPIKMLVGMDATGVLTKILVTDHREPYGYFSVDLPEFATQFEAKNIRDRFRVGDDIDAISRATISVTSASRAVRNSARRIARAYLTPPEE
jgi:NosR/NirI family nitrous oxide reductase transcriptional regulator